MKALTIWQPWASLIVAGAKPFEFRSHRARSIVGERIVIHAGLAKVDREQVEQMHFLLSKRPNDIMAKGLILKPLLAVPVLARFLDNDLPWASGLGTAIVGEPRLGTEIAAEFGVPRANDSDRDEHSNWGWPMLDIEKWDTPVPMRGKQGLWPWPTPEDLGL
jgi:hypothetical protein